MKTSSKMTKTMPTLLILLLGSSLIISGCQATKSLLGKRDDGSLAYQQSTKLAPIELPAGKQTAPFVPLYATPNAGANTLTLENESGQQYQLPKPQRMANNAPQ